MMGASSSVMHSRSARKSAIRRQRLSCDENEGCILSETSNGEEVSVVKRNSSKNDTPDEILPSSSQTPIVKEKTASSKTKDDNDSSNDKDLVTALKKLHLPKPNESSAQDLIKNNEEFSNTFLKCIKSIMLMTDGNDSDILSVLNDINFIFFEVRQEKRTIIGDFLSHINYSELSFKLYKKILKNLDMECFQENDLSNSETSELIFLIRSHWWNFSDCSLMFGATLVTHGIIQEMVLDLQNIIDVDEKTLKYSFTFESAIGTLHNVAKMENFRRTFRDLKLVDILGNFLNYENLAKVTMLTLLTLALIIDENQTDLLFSHESSFDLLIQLANRAWKMNDHRYDGFSVEELILGLKGLSKNDKVKRLLVEKKILELVIKILNGGKNDEKEIAAKLLWELSFDPTNKALILDDETIRETLKSLSNDPSKKIARTAQGVLWVLDMGTKMETPKQNEKEKLTGKQPSKRRGHIMISYNWNDQKQMIMIKDSLKSHGFPVWMDIENISGSTLQAMAEAVEGASLVLICFSERYKESINCRSEAEYAFALNKPIVPLLMQEQYKADGWLGILLGTKMYFDFSGRFGFEPKMSELLKDLAGRGLTNTDEDTTDGPIVKTTAPLVGKAPKPDPSKIDVKKWILEHKLEKYPVFQALEPFHVQFMKKISLKAPEFYYQLVMDLLSGKLTLENLNSLVQVTVAVDKFPT